MSYELTGKLVAKYDTVQRTESFKTREFVVEKTDDFNGRSVTNYVKFQCVQDQRPIELTIQATGGIIEGAIRHGLTVTIHIAKYRTTKPVLVNNTWQFAIQGKALFSVADSKLFTIELVNDVVSYGSAF